MTPQLRRVVITLAVIGLATGVALVTVVGPGRTKTPASEASESVTAEGTGAPPGAAAGDVDETGGAARPDAAPPTEPPPPPVASPTVEAIEGLHGAWVPAAAPQTLGSLDPRQAVMEVKFSLQGAAIEQITLSKYWLTAADSRAARAHYEALDRGVRQPPPLPPEGHRYILQKAQPFSWIDLETGQVRQVLVGMLAANTIRINGEAVSLMAGETDGDGEGRTVWKEMAAGVFESTIVDGNENPVARIERRFELTVDYKLALSQSVTNLTDDPLEVLWIQYGPGGLIADRSRYLDMRRFRFGYLPDAVGFPEMVASGNGDLLVERRKALKRVDKSRTAQDGARWAELLSLWPNETSIKKGYELSWFASTNRYFALAVYPPLDVASPNVVQGNRSLSSVVSEIRLDASGAKGDEVLFTGLYSPSRVIPAREQTTFDMGVYAGPLEREILAKKQPLAALRMQGLILYQMSAFCAVCTFQWLARGLLEFLSAVHFVVADWGVAIILLVVVVRTLLHPLTKKAQINMQRFGKVMGDLKPEIEKLQKKYPNDPKKLQQEQMRLMRERGVNPFQFLGCLPMFLQMPIWIALYAMLYFAFELRHQPAFWGGFQLFWDWPFLADLSAADHFFWEFAQPFKFFLWNVTGINALPILLGVVFFIQQKYMSPPPSPSMTPEQIQQQKIMKVMMVVMFPVMLYSAPSGLTLYICTSSFLGIIESRYIRQHINEMDLNPPKPKDKPKRKGKGKDLQARMYADALERAKQKRKGPPKKYKKRK